MRKTKILMTIGPASMALLDVLVPKIDAVRMNFSHGSRASHKKEIREVRRRSDSIPLILDTAGPEIRVLEAFRIDSRGVDPAGLKTTVPLEPEEGDVLLLDDGRYTARMTKKGLVCPRGVEIRKGAKIIIKNKDIGMPTITEKDLKDIEFGVGEGVDAVAVSFVRSVDDVLEVNGILNGLGANDVDVIAKIEHWKALEDVRRIIKASNGVMVARGDLALEIPYQKVPTVQKKLLDLCWDMKRTGIVATQMLHSMLEQTTATRAELSDIANAVLDGADALMLSGETAIGRHPVEAVDVMSKVIEEAEKSIRCRFRPASTSEEMAFSAKKIAERIGAQIFCSTNTGRSVRIITKFRPRTPIYINASSKRLTRQLRLVWGVQEGRPGEGFIVHVKHLTETPGTYVEYKGDIIARGESYGTGMVMGTVGKGIQSLDRRSKGLPENVLAVVYRGEENDPIMRQCIEKEIPVILLDQKIEEGRQVVLDFEFGLVLPYKKGEKYSHLLNRFPQLLGKKYDSV